MLSGGLTLSDAASTADRRDRARPDARRRGDAACEVDGAAALRGAARLQRRAGARRRGRRRAGGTPRLETVVLDADRRPGPARALRGDARARATSRSSARPPRSSRPTAPSATARIARQHPLGPAGRGVRRARAPSPRTTRTTAPQPGHADGPGDRHVDPGFAPGSARLAAGSPLIDAGTPARARRHGVARGPRRRCPRIADGNGDGVLVRDLGAFELAPPAVPLPAGNLLADPSGEEGGGVGASAAASRASATALPVPVGGRRRRARGGRGVLRRRHERREQRGPGRLGRRGSRPRSTSARRPRRWPGCSAASAPTPTRGPARDVPRAGRTAARRRGAGRADARPSAGTPRAAAARAHRRGPAADASIAVALEARRVGDGELQRRVLRQPRPDRHRAGRAAAARPGRSRPQAVRRRARAQRQGARSTGAGRVPVRLGVRRRDRRALHGRR